MKRFQILFFLILPTACAPVNDRLWADSDIIPSGEPAYEYRLLNHWDNLDDTVERGYAGKSIWGWTEDEIPEKSIRLYGELNRKIGINGAVLNNVNASPEILTDSCLKRVAAIAGVLRDYGIRTYLSVNFAAPMALGELPTADPCDAAVAEWWRNKVNDIYSIIPDFGGFLVKASSEGQPGPQDFGRTHVEGANMLADALEPHGGTVMWRAFVYSPDNKDRARQAYDEFAPLDGQFRDNVSIQVKNGPVDFQPREPFSPLFGAMRSTSVNPEFQITQEYLGQSRNLVFTAPMWAEVLQADTYRDGEGSTVARNTSSGRISAVAGVANTGQSDDLCGSIWAQANWYAFGRLAWDPSLSPEAIAEEWLRCSFRKPWYVSQKRFSKRFIEPTAHMMTGSYEACVNYMMPLGFHHLFAKDHHYGPDPGCFDPNFRPDWLPSYYHRADSLGVGFDRSRSGSGACDQYNEPLASLYDGPDCPESLLLWFHHVPWSYRMKDGRTLWENICSKYDEGVRTAEENVRIWKRMRPYVDRMRFESMMETLEITLHDAQWWRDTCLNYFSTFSGMQPATCSTD